MPSIVAIRKQFDALPDEVKSHFGKLRELLENAHLEIALAYIFLLLEQGRYRALKCILVRELHCSAKLVDAMYKDYEFQRKTFQKTIKDLVNIDLQSPPFVGLEASEVVRDKLFHGRRPKDEELRDAISRALEFVANFGAAIQNKTGKNPFGDLRGLSSRMKMLSGDQARWIIKGVKTAGEAK